MQVQIDDKQVLDEPHPRYPTFAIAVAAVLLSAAFTVAWTYGLATSEESHLVFNYIQENGLPAEWETKFNAVNNNWPPSRNKLAVLLLEAQLAVTQRASK